MKITVAALGDTEDWASLREALWPSHDMAEHAMEIAELLANPNDTLTLIARDGDGVAIGFAEASLRHDYVNGCSTSPVGFLEGIYVQPQHRRARVAARLVEAVAAWARNRGCTEMASDAATDNTQSHAMHNALGFVETQRVVYFRKLLNR